MASPPSLDGVNLDVVPPIRPRGAAPAGVMERIEGREPSRRLVCDLSFSVGFWPLELPVRPFQNPVVNRRSLPSLAPSATITLKLPGLTGENGV
jgi:hypothetical protein